MFPELTALGLLGWEFQDGTLQSKGVMFPWHDDSLLELFEQVSEAGVGRVQELFEMLTEPPGTNSES